MAKLPAPVNSFVEFWKGLVEQLEKLGVDAAVAWATAAQPWLAWPIVSFLFKLFVEFMGSKIGRVIFSVGAKTIIIVQGEIKKDNLDSAVKDLKKDQGDPNVTPEEHSAKLEKARKAADDFIHRGKRP